ncbi:MAG TPA: VIT1/CCC1 transporter family protein [Longimicrobiales bacterium]
MPGAVLPPEPSTPREIFRHYLRDLVYGANDGIITTFAVVAGVTGADLATGTILILGIANLFADGVSMGASNYLSIRSDEAARAAEGRGQVEPHAHRHGIATFLAFLVAGAVPLVAYLVPVAPTSRFPLATAFTLLTLFGVGALRTLVTARGWGRSGLEMLVVGAVAAAIAYTVGGIIARLTGVRGVG